MNRIVITDEAAATKRQVGPTAWVVFEHLALNANDDLEALASARSIGAAVSISKDTAAGAIRRLASAGIVERCRQERVVGRFGARALLVNPPPGTSIATASTSRRGQRESRRTSRPAVEPASQLTLLDVEPPPASPTSTSTAIALTHQARGSVHEFASSDAERPRERVCEANERGSC